MIFVCFFPPIRLSHNPIRNTFFKRKKKWSMWLWPIFTSIIVDFVTVLSNEQFRNFFVWSWVWSVEYKQRLIKICFVKFFFTNEKIGFLSHAELKLIFSLYTEALWKWPKHLKKFHTKRQKAWAPIRPVESQALSLSD